MMFWLGMVGGLLLTGWGSGLLIAKRLREIAWDYCPQTAARFDSGSVYRLVDVERPYVGYVIYSYDVKAKQFSGWCARSFPTRRDAMQFVNDCRAGSLVARYRSENPRESRLFAETETKQQMCSDFCRPVPS